MTFDEWRDQIAETKGVIMDASQVAVSSWAWDAGYAQCREDAWTHILEIKAREAAAALERLTGEVVDPSELMPEEARVGGEQVQR